jgi:hypothetical protein
MYNGFYELRLRITELFYYSHIEEKYNFLQCASICFESYTHELNKSNINSINTVFTICCLLLKHGCFLQEFQKNIVYTIELYKNIDIKQELSSEEYEVLLEDYEEIKKHIN